MMKTVAEVPAEATLGCPTRVRHGVVGLAMALAAVTYLDRACLGTLVPQIMESLKLTKEQMSWAMSAFQLGYAIFGIPAASWASQRSMRVVLSSIVAWWSSFTIATAGAFNLASLVVIRFLFGAGEAGAWPCVTITFSHWIPKGTRGRIQGIFFAGAHLTGGLTPFLVMWLVTSCHLLWRTVFILFGLVGFVWSAGWWLWFRDEPSQHPGTNEAERRLIMEGRQTTTATAQTTRWEDWRLLFWHRNTWPLCLMYVANFCPFFFCITWLPTYLAEQHHLMSLSLGWASGLPLTMSVLGDIFGGVTTDWAVRRFGLRIGRCGVGAVAYAVAGVAMFLAATTTHPMACVWLFSVSVASAMFILGAAWATCIDIGGSHSGIVSATMNTAGGLAALCVPPLTIWLKNHYTSWNAPLFVMSALFAIGVACWCVIDPRKRVFD